MTKQELQTTWNKKATEVLKGRRITHVQYVEGDSLMHGYGLAIVLDNDTHLYVMSDDEGNDWGALHYVTKEGKQSILPTL